MSGAPRMEGEYGWTPFRVVEVLVGHWRVAVGLPLAGAVVALALTLLGPPTFTAESRFTVDSEADAARAAPTLALQFGLPLQALGGPPVLFYVELIRSRDLQLRLLETPLVTVDGGPGTLGSILREGEGDGAGTRAALEELNRRIAIRVDVQANLVTVNTTMGTPDQAERVNRRITELIDVYNREIRQTQAGSERAFVASRLEERRAELRQAEDALQSFLEENRRYESSPELLMRRDRLDREVAARESVVAGLVQNLEDARIREARDVPAITLVDRPEGSAVPDRRLVPSLVLGLLGGGMAAVLWMILVEFLTWHARERTAEYRRFQEMITRLRTSTRAT